MHGMYDVVYNGHRKKKRRNEDDVKERGAERKSVEKGKKRNEEDEDAHRDARAHGDREGIKCAENQEEWPRATAITSAVVKVVKIATRNKCL